MSTIFYLLQAADTLMDLAAFWGVCWLIPKMYGARRTTRSLAELTGMQAEALGNQAQNIAELDARLGLLEGRPCPPDDEIVSFMTEGGGLTKPQEARIKAHLNVCPKCGIFRTAELSEGGGS